MHELSIASAILDAVRNEAEKRPGAHVTKVGVRIGALSGVEPEALSFGFSALVQGTDLEPLALVIEPVPRRQRCPACDLPLRLRRTAWRVPAARAARRYWPAAMNWIWRTWRSKNSDE